MAVQPQTPYKEYTANGSTKSFALEFDCDNQDHLIVLVDDVEAIVGTWSLSNGAVVFGNAPTTGKKITVQRNTPFRRDGDFQSYDNSFRPGPVNKGFDWIWLKLQELGVADWILSNRINDLRAYVDKQDNVLQDNIDSLKNYVDDKDDELRNYLLNAIQEQGVALDQLEEYYSYLMQQLAQVAIDRGWAASFIVSADGSTQQEINDFGGAKWWNKPLGYDVGSTVKLENGDIAKSTIDGNVTDPNVDMAGWVKVNSADQIFDESGLSQQQINNRLLRSKIVDLSYLSPPENFDFTAILNTTLQLSQQYPIYVILPFGNFKITDSITTGATGKGCILDLNGSTIYVDKRSESEQKLNGHEYNSVILYSTTDAPCAVINGVIDGSRREQNLFRETDYPTLLNKITNGVFISAKTIAFDGLKLRHMYGQTSKFENANLVNIKDSEIKDCGGHWYQNDGFDAFGDSFYIKAGEASQQNIQVNIDRTTVVAKSSDQYPENSTMFPTPKYSRIGITLESLEAGVSSNLKMTIRDSSFDKVERFIHQEQLLNSSILIENSVVNSVVTFGAYLTETMEVVSNESDYKMLAGDYNGSKGLARQYISDYLSVLLNDGSIDANNFEYPFGNGSSSTVLNNVKTINVNGRLAENPSGLSVHGGSIKYNDAPSTGWLMGVNGDYKLDSVTLDATATTLREFNYGVPTSVKNCKFKNMLIGRGFERYYNKRNFFNNQLYMDFSGYADYFGSSYEINDLAGNLLREECLMWGADRDIGVKGLFTHNTVARSSGGASLNLIGTNELILGKKRPLILVVVRASANPEFFAINEIDSSATKAFYVAVAKYNATTNSYSVVKPFVSSHSTPTFTLAFTDLTVNTFGAGVTNVHWAVLPYSEMQSLPVIPDSIIL